VFAIYMYICIYVYIYIYMYIYIYIYRYTYCNTNKHTVIQVHVFAIRASAFCGGRKIERSLCVATCGYRAFSFFDGCCSTVQGLLDWFEVDLGFTELSFIQIDLCVLCVATCGCYRAFSRVFFVCCNTGQSFLWMKKNRAFSVCCNMWLYFSSSTVYSV